MSMNMLTKPSIQMLGGIWLSVRAGGLMSVCIFLDSGIVRFDDGMVARRREINMKRYR
jgi:hypothetical protein